MISPVKEGSTHFGWIIVGVCFCNLALVYGVWYSFSVFFVALLKEFGWSRSVGAGAFSFFIIISSLMGPFVGNMVHSVGSRKVVLCGSLLLGAGLFLCTLTRSWWQFYIFFSLITAVGLGATGWIPNIIMVQQWFREKRGLPVGIISSGIGIGILFYVPAVQLLIDSFGWRTAFLVMSIFTPLIIIVLAIAFLNDPPKTLPASGSGSEISGRIEKDPLIVNEKWAARYWTIREALRTKEFWLLGFFIFLGNVIVQSTFTHQVAFFVDHGMQALFASYIVGILGVVSIGGKVLWGGLSDKIGREITSIIGIFSSILGMITLILFSLFPSPLLTYYFSFFFGLGYAVIATLPPLIALDFFEGQGYGGIFGALMIFSGLGGAFGAWVAGFIFDVTGSYVPVFCIMIGCAVTDCLIVWWVAPRRIRIVSGRRPKSPADGISYS
jgi:MFS family permease